MSEWKETTLSDICSDIAYGYTASAKREGEGPKFLRITDIAQDRINWNDVPICDANEDAIKKYKLKNGDIVIARTGATTGHNKIMKNLAYDAVFASYLIRYEIDKTKAFPDYIGHILQSSFWYDYVDAIAGGSAQPGANAKQLGSFEISLPSIKEQKSIASVLSSLDNKIDLLHRQNKTLEAMAETVFRQWFVEEAGDWKEKPLKDVCVIQNGYAFQSQTYRESGQKILRTMNFSNHWIELKGFVYISNELAKSFEKFYIQRNDFLLVMVGASLGNFAIVTKDVLPALQNQNMWCFRANKDVPQHYLNFVLRQLINETLHGASGSAREFFQKGVFYELKIVVPPADLMKRFEEVSEAIFSKIELNRYQMQSLENIRDALLPKLMSGEVRVA